MRGTDIIGNIIFAARSFTMPQDDGTAKRSTSYFSVAPRIPPPGPL
jgi:hypothetical protein